MLRQPNGEGVAMAIARTTGDSYGDVTVKAMAMAMETVPRVKP
jgi:hypothetical protein